MVNLELYRIFKIVAEEQNITKASDKLGISQPAVTKHIKNLEQELNIKLFERTRYGMALTNDGKKIYSHIKEPINILLSTETLLMEAKEINFGVHINLPSYIYSSNISKFYKDNPEVTINVKKSYTENMFSLLEKNDIDIFLSKKFDTDLYKNMAIDFIPIGYLHDEFIVNANSKYTREKFIPNKFNMTTIYTLRKASGTYTNLLQTLKANNVKKPEIKDMTFSSIIEILKNEDVLTFITKEYVKEELEDKKLKIIDTGLFFSPIQYGIYYNTKNNLKNTKKIVKYFKNN